MKVQRPVLLYEVITGHGPTRRVTHFHSRAEADLVYERMRKMGKKPALFLGELHLKGPR